MAIVRVEMDDLHYMESEVEQRRNGSRVLRLLRELPFIDGKLASSIQQAGDFPLVTAALTVAVVTLAVVVVNLPHAQAAAQGSEAVVSETF